jgi:hypothetical protein
MGEVNGKVDVKFCMSKARVEEGALVLGIIATRRPQTVPHEAVSSGSWCPIAISWTS